MAVTNFSGPITTFAVTCALCRKPVKDVTCQEDDYGKCIIIDAECHGRRWRTSISKNSLEFARDSTILRNLIAFEEDAVALNRNDEDSRRPSFNVAEPSRRSMSRKELEYELEKAFQNNDTEKVKKLMQFYEITNAYKSDEIEVPMLQEIPSSVLNEEAINEVKKPKITKMTNKKKVRKKRSIDL